MNMSHNTTEKKKKAKYELSDLDVFEISLVSKPAIGRTYLMTKAADTVGDVVDTESSVSESETEAGTSPATEGEKVMNEKLTELLKSAELELDEAFAGALNTMLSPEFKEAVPIEIMTEIYKLAEYEIPKEEIEVVKEVEVEKIVEKIVEVEKATEPTPEDDKEEVLKGLTPEAQALFKEISEKAELLQKAAAELAAKSEEERQARLEQEFVQKAAESYKHLPFKADELGPVLKSISDKLDEKEAETVLGIFTSADEALKDSDQLEEVGVSDTGEETTINTSEPAWLRKAKELVAKGDFDNVPKATEHLVRAEPKLFLEG